MGALDDIHAEHQMQAAAARVAMGRLVRLYLTHAGDGAEPPQWQQAAAGAVARTMPRVHVHEAFDEIKVLRSRFLADEATWTAGEWSLSTRQVLDRVCPQRHRSAAREMARRMIGAVRTAEQPVTIQVTADLYGAAHGAAAGLAVFIHERAKDRRDALAALPDLETRLGDRDALSVYLREERRRRVDVLKSLASQKQEYMLTPDDCDAVLDDLRLVAPESPETAPRDWPGGWVLRRDGRDVFGPAGHVAWVSEAEAREAAAELAGAPVEVVWSPFADADPGGTIVLDRHLWSTPIDGSTLVI